MPHGWADKIVELEQLKSRIRQLRRESRTIVQCHGCFDIVHPGHIRYLEFARQQGDVLVVSLTGDSAMSKGDQRPYIPQELRAENLAALMFVDLVYIDPHPTAARTLDVIRPDVYVKGREYEGSTDSGFLEEKKVVEGYGGRIIFSSGEIVFSSTTLIDRLPTSKDLESHRLNLLCRRYDITREAGEQILARFQDLHVIVVGDCILDRYVLCDVMGVASEAAVLSLTQREQRTFVGGAAIVARHVAALGAHAFLLSTGGADEGTRCAKEVLDSEGVEHHLIPSRPALVEKSRFLVDEDKLFKVDQGQSHPLDSVAQRRAAQILEQQSKLADAVIFCDFGYGMITPALLERVLPTLRHNVRVLAADASGSRANLLGFRNVDLLCPTEREARAMLHDFDSGLSSVAWNLLARTQARHLLVTMDKRGMVVFRRGSSDRRSPEWSGRLRSEQLPSLADRTVDRLGCGDALLAAATLALSAGAELMHAAYLGAAAAALAIGVLGNVPVGSASLSSWLSRRPELVRTGSTLADPMFASA